MPQPTLAANLRCSTWAATLPPTTGQRIENKRYIPSDPNIIVMQTALKGWQCLRSQLPDLAVYFAPSSFDLGQYTVSRCNPGQRSWQVSELVNEFVGFVLNGRTTENENGQKENCTYRHQCGRNLFSHRFWPNLMNC